MVRLGIPAHIGKSNYRVSIPYVGFIKDAGFDIMLISPENPEVLALCDMLLLPGGVDINPTTFGYMNDSSYNCDPERDEFEISLVQMAMTGDKPIFGICRGLQMCMYMLFHERGSNDEIRLWQNINGHALASSRQIPRSIPSHPVRTNVDRLYGKFVNEAKSGKVPPNMKNRYVKDGSGLDDVIFVNSMHHQGWCFYQKNAEKFKDVEILASILVKEEDKKDGPGMSIKLVEAAIIPSMKAFLVQWHPEEMGDVAILKNAVTMMLNLSEKDATIQMEG